jgi:hypothetical protein
MPIALCVWLVGALVCFAHPFAALAAQITLEPPLERTVYYPLPHHPGLSADGWTGGTHAQAMRYEQHIRINGSIEKGDADRLSAVLKEVSNPQSYAVVSLNSPGGNFAEALAMGDVIHAHGIATVIFEDDACFSACAFIFLAGMEIEVRGRSGPPSRHLYLGAKLGFHAPFHDLELSNGSLDVLPMATVADMFYGAARNTVRELQDNMATWRISPAFIFEVLGKGRDEYLSVENIATFYANQITLISSRPAVGFQSHDELSDEQIANACAFSRFRTVFDTTLTTHPEDALRVALHWDDELGNKHLSGIQRSDDRVIVPMMVPGFGPFDCEVVAEHGVVSVYNSSRRGGHTGFALNPYLVSGLRASWNNVEERNVAERRVASPPPISRGRGPAADVNIVASDSWGDIKGPSFSCSGKLAPVEQMICGSPALSKLDGILSAVYKPHAKVDSVRKAQRQWLKTVRNGCLKNGAASRATEDCLAAAYTVRIQQIRELGAR